MARKHLHDVVLEPRLLIDSEADFNEVLGDTYQFLRSLAPFGQEHPPPAFVARNVEVTELRQIGKDGQHMRLTLRQNGEKWDAVAFKQNRPKDLVKPGDSTIPTIDLVYIPEINDYNGRRTMQFRLLDFRTAKT
mgnify:FL=1